MDERFRKLQRNYLRQSADTEAAAAYINILEQRLGVAPEEKRKVAVNDPTIPCLLCEKAIPKESATNDNAQPWLEIVEREPELPQDAVRMHNPWQGVSVSTSGNYGSQVLDMHSVYFYICDGCLIRHSHKMFHYGQRYDEGKGIENARDYFESWFRSVKENRADEEIPSSEDSYLQTVEPYFKSA